MFIKKRIVESILSLSFVCACPLFAVQVNGEVVSSRSPELKLNVELYNKERSIQLDQARAGDSVVVRITPQKINGEAFTKRVDSMTVALESHFQLLVNENPVVSLNYPCGITGPNDRYVIFTKIPDCHGERIRASGLWPDPATGRLVSISGEINIRLLPGPPERVVFHNPSSSSKGLSPVRIIPGIAYACTLAVYDRFMNRVRDPVEVIVRSLTQDIAAIVGGTPDLTITTDSFGVGAFLVQLTDQAKTNDIVRLEAEIAEETNEDSIHTAKMSLVYKEEWLKDVYSFHRPIVRKNTFGCFDLKGRRVSRSSFSVRITPQGHTVIFFLHKKN